jgi:tripartite-type tricarboxylate transporter receptor subunit TctC
MMRMLRALACLAALVTAGAGQAQNYPSSTVRIIVPYPAGGPTDQLARTMAPVLSQKFGQNVIVENVTGGGTNIATARVARAAPDGHTLLLHNLQISANVTLYGNLPFDTEKDLTPIIFVNHQPLVLIGRKTLEPNNLQDLLALMKTRPLKAATPGVGATGHLATTLLAQEAKVTIDQIPYRGGAPIMTDIAGGHIDLFFGTPQQVLGPAQGGQVKAFGITAKEPSPHFPTAASFVQALGPKLEILYWHALFAPAGTPDAVVTKLNAAVQDIIADPATLKQWSDIGVAPYPKEQRSPAGARALLKSEIARWGKVIHDNNITID